MNAPASPVARGVLLVLMLIALGACASQPQGDRLYRELGGDAGIARLVDAFLLQLAADERIVDSFADTDIEAFRARLIEQFCALSGGPCEYTGRDMVEAHRGLGIDDAQFNALVEDLMAAMTDVDLPWGARNRLLRLLAPMHREIVADSNVAPAGG